MSKTILITGSTDGIGKIAAEKFANDNYKLILHGRNKSKLNTMADDLKSDAIVADFSVLSEVAEMAEKINEKYEKIDVIINNAGVFKSAQALASNGIDLRLVVNYLAPVLLTQKLKSKLNEDSILINLSSAAQSPVNLNALSENISLGMQDAYAQSKLALTMWSFDFAQKNPSQKVIALNPGSLLNTNMVREAYGKSWSSADKGGNIIYELATGKITANEVFNYFDNDLGDPRGAFGKAHPDAYDQSKIERLITKTDEVLKSY